MQNNLFKKFLIYSSGTILSFAVGLLYTMISTRLISPESYGHAEYLTMFISIASLVILLGGDQLLIRLFYEEQNKSALLHRCLKNSMLAFAAIVILFSGVNLLNQKLQLFDEIHWNECIIIFVGAFVQMLYQFGDAFLRMLQKEKVYSTLLIIFRVLNLVILLVAYLILKNDYRVILIATIGSYAILVIIYIIIEKEYWLKKGGQLSATSTSGKELLKMGLPLVATTIVTWLFQSIDKISIKWFYGYDEIGFYSAAAKIVAIVGVLQMAFTTFWTPVCYEHYAKNPKDKTLYQEVNQIVSFVMLTAITGVIAFKDLFIIILGSEFESASILVPFLLFMPILYTVSETTVIGINFQKKMYWHVVIATISCVCNFVLNMILVPEYASLGASIATAMAYIVFFSLRTFISLKYYQVDYSLKKFYLIIGILVIYSLLTVFMDNMVVNMIGFLVVISVIIFAYRKYISKIIDIVKQKLKPEGGEK